MLYGIRQATYHHLSISNPCLTEALQEFTVKHNEGLLQAQFIVWQVSSWRNTDKVQLN